MDLNKMKKAELIDYIGELSKTLNRKVSLIERFKGYDQERNKQFDALTIKLADVTAHRNQLDQSQYKLKRMLSELRSEVSKVTNQNITLNDQINELLMELHPDCDSDALIENNELRKQLLKPINQCIQLREELDSVKKSLSDSEHGKVINELQLELRSVKRQLAESNKRLTNANAIINADEGKTNVKNLIHARDAMYVKRIKGLENQVKDLKNRIKKYEKTL